MKYTEHDFNTKEFVSPGRVFSPVLSWVWNAPVSAEETKRQLDGMAEMGFRACYIIPEPKAFRPTSQITTLEPDYLTDEFFSAVRSAEQYAAEKGISMWLYDEGGWPSGSACGHTLSGHPELRSKRLFCEKKKAGCGERFDADEHDGRRILRLYRAADREELALPYEAAGDEELILCGYSTVGAPDLLDPETLKRFTSLTHDGYAAAFGDELPELSCMFTDEPTPVYPPYLPPETFESLCGYDYTDHLLEILGDGYCAQRADYCDLWSRMAADNFYGALADWAHAHGILSVGHLNDDHEPTHFFNQGGQLLRLLRRLDIPGVDVIWGQINKDSAPDMIFPHFASSAASQCGGSYALTESFAIYGSGCDYDRMRYVLCQQAVRGVNIFNFMSASYGNDRFAASQARPDYRPDYPAMEGMKEFNAFASRLSYIASAGRSDTHSALFYPIRDIWACGAGRDVFKEAFVRIGRGLDELLVPYDIVDDDFLAECRLENGALTNGKVSYNALYIPAGSTFTDGEKELIADFENAGGRVFFDIAIAEKGSGGPLFDITPKRCGIRAARRITESGDRIYLLFNESADEVSAEIRFDEKGCCYCLGLDDGNIYSASNNISLDLRSGECRAYIFTSKPLECGREYSCGMPMYVIGGWDVHMTRSFAITPDGVKYEAAETERIHTSDGDFASLFGDDFSGEAVFECMLPSRFTDCVLHLDDVGCCCRAELVTEGNNVQLGTRVFTPFEFIVPAGESALLRLTVASTAGAAYAAYNAADDFTPAEIGPYNARMKVLEEQDRRGGLFGDALLYRAIITE